MNVKGTRQRLITAHANDYAQLVRLAKYYEGKQPLPFIDSEVQRALGNRLMRIVANWPRLNVDSLEQRLDVEGFRSPSRPGASDDLWALWQANGLDETSSQAHTDALIFGRSFIMVWAGIDPRVPRITVESPLQMITETDPMTGQVVGALKRWQDLDHHGRAIVLTLDEVVQYRSRNPHPDSTTFTGSIDAWEVVDSQPNPLGRVPVVPIVNRPRPLLPLGESEMLDAIQINDGLNHLLMAMLISAEYHAAPRRWVTGLGAGGRMSQENLESAREQIRQEWEQARASKIWLADSPDTKFGQFPEAQLDGFISAINLLTRQVAAISGLPPHYVALAAENSPASADAIRSAEASLVNRARRRQRAWGGAWEEVMRLALAVRDGVYPTGLADLDTVWRSPEIVSIAQAADAAVKLHAEGILDQRSVLERLDYSPQAISTITE